MTSATWRVSPKSRQNVIDMLRIDATVWHGRLDEIDFLGRIWDLELLPSDDPRFPTATGDIFQHRVRNPTDWPDDWIFSDGRFDLLHGEDGRFLSFLCETVHPVVRPDAEEANELVKLYNDCLATDGVQLIPTDRLGSRSVHEPRFRMQLITPTTAFDFDQYPRLTDPGALHDQLKRIDASLEDDPAAAIGSSKELVESICKIILNDFEAPAPKGTDMPALYKLVAQELRLDAKDIPESAKGSRAAQMTLRTLVTTIQSLAQLRNELGTGHGGVTRSPAFVRHGRLAFHAAVTVSDFLLATWHERRKGETS